MNAWAWNGSSFEHCNALPLSDRGFRHGMAVFETIRICKGKPEFLPAHLDRLQVSCLERHFVVDQSVFAHLKVFFSGLQSTGIARIYITAGDGSILESYDHPRIFILEESRDSHLPDSYRLAIHPDFYQPVFGGLKTANYWFNADALRQATHRKADEALLFHHSGALVSACMANVFLVQGGTIYTPAKASGCRNGVVREWVIQNNPVTEKQLHREDVIHAEEIFLTNSWIGVMPVSLLEDRPLDTGKISRQIRKKFRAQFP